MVQQLRTKLAALDCEFTWKRIWTLNIDDVVVKVFQYSRRPLESLSWNERFSQQNPESGQQIVHLHGMAKRITHEGDNNGVLVFSLSEVRPVKYLIHGRGIRFSTMKFAGKPFLVIGSQLTEEIDLIDALDQGSTAFASTGFPSVMVVPSISPIRPYPTRTSRILGCRERWREFREQFAPSLSESS